MQHNIQGSRDYSHSLENLATVAKYHLMLEAQEAQEAATARNRRLQSTQKQLPRMRTGMPDKFPVKDTELARFIQAGGSTLMGAEYTCEWGSCGLPFKCNNGSDVLKHFRVHHFPLETIKIESCDEFKVKCLWRGCGILFRSDGIFRHVGRAHTTGFQTNCPHCWKPLACQDNLKGHLAVCEGKENTDQDPKATGDSDKEWIAV